jgi:hypothetical protein
VGTPSRLVSWCSQLMWKPGGWTTAQLEECKAAYVRTDELVNKPPSMLRSVSHPRGWKKTSNSNSLVGQQEMLRDEVTAVIWSNARGALRSLLLSVGDREKPKSCKMMKYSIPRQTGLGRTNNPFPLFLNNGMRPVLQAPRLSRELSVVYMDSTLWSMK